VHIGVIPNAVHWVEISCHCVALKRFWAESPIYYKPKATPWRYNILTIIALKGQLMINHSTNNLCYNLFRTLAKQNYILKHYRKSISIIRESKPMQSIGAIGRIIESKLILQ